VKPGPNALAISAAVSMAAIASCGSTSRATPPSRGSPPATCAERLALDRKRWKFAPFFNEVSCRTLEVLHCPTESNENGRVPGAGARWYSLLDVVSQGKGHRDMDKARFWELVAASRASFDPRLRDGNMDKQVERLEALLRDLAPAEIVDFQRELDEREKEAYRWDLWAAAFIIGGGCSDDCFTDFRSWLISMGREVYEAALKDPDGLVDVADADGVEEPSFEEFQYVPRRVYEEKTGKDLPASGIRRPAEPTGEEWAEDGDDLSRLLPRLWAKFGDA
jgi:hypothetical protein